MFDISFIELITIGVVALVVLGPERLPAAARTLGSFLRKARESFNSVRAEFEREIGASELKQQMSAVRQSLTDTGAAIEGNQPTSNEATAPERRPPHD